MPCLKTRRKILFWLGIFIYVSCFLIFYPEFFSITDESAYLQAAGNMIEGKIAIDDPFDSYNFPYSKSLNKFIPGYYPGNSAILLPFALVSWKLIFLVGLIFHLLNTYILSRIFKEYGLNKVYSLFYLLYPGFIFYSRTVMAEIPTITFTLLGFYFFLRNKSFLSGFMLGISCLIRPTNALIIIAFCIPSFLRLIQGIFLNKEIRDLYVKRLIYFTFGVLPSFILALLFNYVAYGSIFSLRYSGGGVGILNEMSTFALSQLIVYLKPITILFIIYPLMFILPLCGKYKKKSEIVWTMVLFFLILGKVDVVRYSWLINLVIGHRYFFTIIPLMLIPYCLFLKKHLKYFVPFIILLLIIMSPIIMYKQSLYTDNKFKIMQEIYKVIPEESAIVSYANPEYLSSYFGKDNKAIKFGGFNKLNYSGKYFLFNYENEKLLTNLRKMSDKIEINEKKMKLENYIKSHELKLFYENKGVKIFTN